jgi:hypothetical protein
MLKSRMSHADIAKEFGLSIKKVKENLFSTTSGRPTISQLSLKILENSDAAKELGIRIAERIKDEITSRKKYKEFPKLKKHEKSKRIMAFPTDPVQLHEDE